MVRPLIALALTIGWIPIFVRFLRAWRVRKNPVSLAICATISFLMYHTVVPALVELNLGNWIVADGLTILFNAFVLLNFYASFRWSEQRFSDERKRSVSVQPPNAPKDLGS